jgi:hypothetical protein
MTVSNAKAWDVGYNAGIDLMESVLLRILANPTSANIRNVKQTIKPATNPYKES